MIDFMMIKNQWIDKLTPPEIKQVQQLQTMQVGY